MSGTLADFSGRRRIAILGGGPAGLASGWALEMLGTDYTIFEKSSVHGGNARTVRSGEFLYDTGPHRFHARDPEATRRVHELLGPDIHEVSAPSRIYWGGQFIDFPLRPLQVLRNGGVAYASRAAVDLLAARRRKRNGAPPADFASFANAWFGHTIADTFLIPFSERLWGLPGTQLSPDIAGRRLPGFSVKGIIKEALFGTRSSDHLEGRFLYPLQGYGQIADKMAERLSGGQLLYRHRVVSLEAEGDEIVSVGVKAGADVQMVRPEVVINTLPITMVAQMLSPPPPTDVLEAASRLRFRDLVLVVLFLDQESISDAAVTYFQSPDLDFTRVHEPRNRSRTMSPPGKTSLVVEFPCFQTDEVWTRDEGALVDYLAGHLEKIGLIRASRVIGSDVHRLRNAYPVYSKDYKATSEVVLSHLRGFQNLWSLGRGGSFFYGHVHDFITDGFATAASVNQYLTQRASVGV